MTIRIVIQPRPPGATPKALAIHPYGISLIQRPMRILDLDCEARPLHWISGDYVSKEITAMAWAWTDRPDDVTCYLLGEVSPETMLQNFLTVYQQADMVTGHYIRGYDLPMINGALSEYGLPPLANKLAHDTKTDLIRRQGLSNSQESLGAMLKLDHAKASMNQATWRAANRLQPEGLASVRVRVVGDVQQHIELRKRLLELGYLGRPRMWDSKSLRDLARYEQ